LCCCYTWTCWQNK